jgi:hypothetical protein
MEDASLLAAEIRQLYKAIQQETDLEMIQELVWLLTVKINHYRIEVGCYPTSQLDQRL